MIHLYAKVIAQPQVAINHKARMAVAHLLSFSLSSLTVSFFHWSHIQSLALLKNPSFLFQSHGACSVCVLVVVAVVYSASSKLISSFSVFKCVSAFSFSSSVRLFISFSNSSLVCFVFSWISFILSILSFADNTLLLRLLSSSLIFWILLSKASIFI